MEWASCCCRASKGVGRSAPGAQKSFYFPFFSLPFSSSPSSTSVPAFRTRLSFDDACVGHFERHIQYTPDPLHFIQQLAASIRSPPPSPSATYDANLSTPSREIHAKRWRGFKKRSTAGIIPLIFTRLLPCPAHQRTIACYALEVPAGGDRAGRRTRGYMRS